MAAMGAGHEATERDDRRLEAAVALGIITADQAAAIRAIAPARPGEPGHGGRGVTAATLAYVLGAITVVVAMGWFLADRWKWLGPGGVLAVVAIYLALVLVVARILRREGYPIAAGFALLLTVVLAPIGAIALGDLLDWYAPASLYACGYPDFAFWTCRGEELLAELAAALAALLALRATRFSLFVAPLAAVGLRILFHVSDTIGRNGLGDATSGWVWVVGASLLAASAYATDRRQRGDEDFALWLHAAGALSGLVATLHLLSANEGFRHLLVPGAFVAFAAALTMRRFPWLLLGMAWFVWYLGWLASEVFRDSPFFPIILAALGIAVIVATVWVQRNAARLVARFGTVTSDGRPRFPGGVPLLLAPALVALLMMTHGAELDRERRIEQRWMERRWARRAAREAAERRARGDTTAAPQPVVSRPPAR